MPPAPELPDASFQQYVQIRGLERLVPVENDRSFTLVDLPKSEFDLRLVATDYTGVGSDTYIGIHGNGKTLYNFIGQIDEIQINDTALSASPNAVR